LRLKEFIVEILTVIKFGVNDRGRNGKAVDECRIPRS